MTDRLKKQTNKKNAAQEQLQKEMVEKELAVQGKREVLLGPFGERVITSGDISAKARRKRLHQIIAIARKYKVMRGLTPANLVNMLEALGPTFVKAGQILSMRSDMLPPEFTKALEVLRANVAPMDFSVVAEVLETEYQKPIKEVFSSIDKTPLGSASVAQVHRAKLKNGDDVAIKVQRPRVRETMAQDIEILRNVLRHLKHFMPADQFIDFDSVINELWASFTQETDFLIEAKNLKEFRANNKDVAFVSAPKPYLDLCTTHVLVMQYIQGPTIAEPKAIEEEGYDLTEIGEKLVENYAKQVLDDGFFHADPHPGNIMIADKKIVFIDLGMMGRLSDSYRAILKKMLLAVSSRDSMTLKNGLLDLSEAVRLDDIDHSAFLADLDFIVQRYGSVDLKDLDLGEFLTELIALTRRYGLELPGSLTMIARGLITLEGVLDEFIPDVSMVQIIEEHLERTEDIVSLLEKDFYELGIDSRQALKGGLKALSQAGLVTDMLTRGQLKVNMDFSNSENPVEDLNHIADRLTMGIIIAGLLIASSIIYFAGASLTILGIPLLGFLGYAIALILALIMAKDILGHRNKRRK